MGRASDDSIRGHNTLPSITSDYCGREACYGRTLGLALGLALGLTLGVTGTWGQLGGSDGPPSK